MTLVEKVTATLLAVFVGALAMQACTSGQNDCSLNPELECFDNGAGGGSTTGTGCDETTRPSPNACQEVAECGAAKWMLPSKAAGTSCGMGTKCDGNGNCKGCDGDVTKCMKAKPCYEMQCTNDECVEEPNGNLTCNNGKGTCDAGGFCGKCDDGIQNGDEAGIDCGPTECGGKCQGDVCASLSECKSKNCRDNRCCDNPCVGNCEACANSLTGQGDGTCAAVTPGTSDNDGILPDCSLKGGCGVNGLCACEDGVKGEKETDIDCGGICVTGNDDVGKCTTGKQCGDIDGSGNCAASNPCVDGVCCSLNQCDGTCRSCNQANLAGLCLPVSLPLDDLSENTCPKDDNSSQSCTPSGTCGHDIGQSCGPCATAHCENSVCKSCSNDNCSGAKVCLLSGYCTATVLVGQECLEDKMCPANSPCLDGVCCATACDGNCMACNFSYTAVASGTCAPILKGYDPQEECPGSGAANWCSGKLPDENGDSPCGP